MDPRSRSPYRFIAILIPSVGLLLGLLGGNLVWMSAWAATPDLPKHLQADETNQYVLLDFYSAYCGTCKVMEPHLKALEKQTRGKVAFRRVDLSEEHNLTYATSFEVPGTPTYVLYNPQGKPVYRMENLISSTILREQVLRATGLLQATPLPTGFMLPKVSTDEGFHPRHLILLVLEKEDCKSCQQLSPYLGGMQMVDQPGLHIVRVDTETDTGKALRKQFKVKQLPALVLLDNTQVPVAHPQARAELYRLEGEVDPRLLWRVVQAFGRNGLE